MRDSGSPSFFNSGNSLNASGGGTQDLGQTGRSIVSSNAADFRTFSSSYDDSVTQTLYMSMLMLDDNTNTSDYSMFGLNSGGTADANRVLQVGILGDNTVSARVNNSDSNIGALGARANGTRELFLIQIDLVNGGDDTVQIWRNPGATFEAADASISVSSLAFDRLSLVSTGGDIRMDEFRFGTELSDVTTAVAAIPEPSSFAILAGMLAFGGATIRRRR